MEVLFIVAILASFYMAWNTGANDVANAMGTSVGSKALTFKQAVILAGIFEFAGAVFVGTHVTNTVRKGIVDPSHFAANPMLLVNGMVAALLASALWLNVASYFGQPVSTTHSIVGAVIGIGLVGGGAIHWGTLGGIVTSWFLSPVASGIIAFITFRFIVGAIFANDSPIEAARRYAPYFVMLVAMILTLSLIYKGLKNLHLQLSLGHALLVAILVSILAGIISSWIVRRKPLEKRRLESAAEYVQVESIFRYLQIVTACYVAFAHGANDVANAVGPLAAVQSIISTGHVEMKVSVPLWVLVLGGFGIVTGLAMFGRRVIVTVGQKITQMTPSRGFSATFAAATTVLVCSKMGLPISTTHALVGAVIGVGLARGIGALQARTLPAIFGAWLATVPIACGLTIVMYFVIGFIFGS